jgi:nitronate monooxygenase
VQRRLVGEWRRGEPRGLDRVNRWAGQAAAMAREEPAGAVVERMWRDAAALLGLD